MGLYEMHKKYIVKLKKQYKYAIIIIANQADI